MSWRPILLLGLLLASPAAAGPVLDEGNGDEPPGYEPEDFEAFAGAPFLAYPGDTIRLSASGSAGPAGVPLEYRWSQVSGPRAELDDEAVLEPAFEATAPGVVTFEVRVGATFEIPGDDEEDEVEIEEVWSDPARSHVVILDPDAGARPDREPGACAAVPAPHLAGGLLVLAGLALRRRRAWRAG